MGNNRNMPKPEKIFMIGPCKAAIFRNVIVRNGQKFTVPKVKFEIRFKDKRSGKWKGTSCMTLPEIPKAILVMQKAFEYLVSNSPATESQSRNLYRLSSGDTIPTGYSYPARKVTKVVESGSRDRPL